MKRLFKTLICALILSALVMPMTVQAADVEVPWSVTFNSSGKMVSTFDSGKVNDAIKGMQPGDSVNLTVSTINANSSTTDWYLRNEIISSLEESAKAAKNAGGAYSYKLTYTNAQTKEETVLFDSETVGGEKEPAEDLEGLNEATSGLKDWLYLDRLSDGQSGTVDLFVLLEGETQSNKYQDTMAELELQFAVEIPEEPSESVKPSDKPSKNAEQSKKSAVKTGDNSQPIIWFIVAAVAGIILLIFAIVSLKKRRTEAAGTANGREDLK